MTFEEVKQFLEQNKDSEEVQEYLQGFRTEPSVEEILAKFESDESLQKWLESEKDKHFSKGLETFKQKTMPKIIEDEIRKRTTGKDEKDLQLDSLKAEIEKIKRDKLRESLKNEAFKFANENKLPSDLIDYFIAIESEDDEEGTKSKESTLSNLNRLKEVWTNHLQESVTERMKSNGYTPKDGDSKPTTLTVEQLKSMSADEIAKLDQSVVNEALKNS
jgi:hypothetical protein